jgi:hypothetical protein
VFWRAVNGYASSANLDAACFANPFAADIADDEAIFSAAYVAEQIRFHCVDTLHIHDEGVALSIAAIRTGAIIV